MPFLPAILESFARGAAPWAAYFGFLVSVGVPGFLRRLPPLLREILAFLSYGIAVVGFGIRSGNAWHRPSLLALTVAGIAVLVLRFRARRPSPSGPVPADRRLWTWVLAGAWPVLVGLGSLLDLLHADLRRAEARAAEDAVVLARSAADVFERSLPEGFAEPPEPDLPWTLPLDEWRATGATRFEAPEWWHSAEGGVRERWDKAATVPFAEIANPWRGLGAGVDGEGSAVAHFLEVRHGIRRGGVADPVAALDAVRAASPDARTPSGVPVAVLAWRELFRQPKPTDARVGSALRGAFLEDVHQRPAIWWPSFREALEAGWAPGDADWTRVVETLRRLEDTTPWRQAVARTLERGSDAEFHWVPGADGRRLLRVRNLPENAFRPGPPVRSGTLYPEAVVRGALRAAADLPSLRPGSGFGLRLRLVGEVLGADGLPDASDWKPLSEAGPSASGPGDGFRVEVGLSDPASYFASVRRQVAWSGGLGAAAALALIGAVFLGRRSYLKLQDLTEAQTNFVAGVTHELRAPLASVRLLAENLQRGADASVERRQEYYGLMVRECRRLGTLVQNVLDWSRIERGRRTYERRRCDLPALIAGTAQVLQPQFDQRRVRLAVRLPGLSPDPSDSEAEVDPDALQQALVNLLDNALKHSPEGSEVVLSLERDAAGWTLAVADAGPGIPEAEQERIFDRFHRLGSELRRETEGIGIGLSIVKHIVEGHGGRIRVESHPGQGARFVVTLPAGKPQSAQGATP